MDAATAEARASIILTGIAIYYVLELDVILAPVYVLQVHSHS